MTGDESGPAVAADRPRPGDQARLLRILSGTWVAQACYALAAFGIPDLMAAGPRTVAELAAASGTDARALHRILRAVAGAGLVRQSAPGIFELASTGQALRSGISGSCHDAALVFGAEVFRSFTEIAYTLRTGKPAFEKVYGKPFYDYLADSPEAAGRFSAAMGEATVPAALGTCDLSRLGTLVDIGGGNGGLLARVLRAHPQARGILLDLPPAIEQARARLARAGVADRVEFAEGSFFDPLPSGGDVYVLSRVLHNWPDADVLRLLGRLRQAIAEDGILLVFEELLQPAAPPAAGPARAGPARAGPAGADQAGGHVTDLLILLMLSGCDRTEAEYRVLLERAGFAISAVRPPPRRGRQAESVIEAIPG